MGGGGWGESKDPKVFKIRIEHVQARKTRALAHFHLNFEHVWVLGKSGWDSWLVVRLSIINVI